MDKAIRLSVQINARWFALIMVDPPFLYQFEFPEKRDYPVVTEEIHTAIQELNKAMPMLKTAQRVGVLGKVSKAVFAKEMVGMYFTAEDGTKFGPVTAVELDLVNIRTE